jgi:hypothetical protein
VTRKIIRIKKNKTKNNNNMELDSSKAPVMNGERESPAPTPYNNVRAR